MTNANDVRDFIGRTAVDPDGDKIGKIEQIYVNDDTGYPQWVTVKTGLFGSKESFAPLRGSQTDGDDVRLAVSKDLVKDAPKIDADGHLNDADNDTLYSHYSGHLADDGQSAGQQSDDATTRSDEQSLADNEEKQSGRARLRRFIVTEDLDTGQVHKEPIDAPDTDRS